MHLKAQVGSSKMAMMNSQAVVRSQTPHSPFVTVKLDAPGLADALLAVVAAVVAFAVAFAIAATPAGVAILPVTVGHTVFAPVVVVTFVHHHVGHNSLVEQWYDVHHHSYPVFLHTDLQHCHSLVYSSFVAVLRRTKKEQGVRVLILLRWSFLICLFLVAHACF